MAESTYMAVEELEVYRKLCQEIATRNVYAMLNGLEKTLKKKIPVSDRRWHVEEDHVAYG